MKTILLLPSFIALLYLATVSCGQAPSKNNGVRSEVNSLKTSTIVEESAILKHLVIRKVEEEIQTLDSEKVQIRKHYCAYLFTVRDEKKDLEILTAKPVTAYQLKKALHRTDLLSVAAKTALIGGTVATAIFGALMTKALNPKFMTAFLASSTTGLVLVPAAILNFRSTSSSLLDKAMLDYAFQVDYKSLAKIADKMRDQGLNSKSSLYCQEEF